MARGTQRGLKPARAMPDGVIAVDGADAEAMADAPVSALLGFQLRRAHTLFALHWQLSFRGQSPRVTPMQGGMLLVIESQPGLTQAMLARIMDVEGPTLLQALGKLEQNGLVTRTRRDGDRRSFALQLTRAGQRAIVLVKDFVPHREQELLTDLSEEERSLLLDLLRRVVRRGQIVTAALSAEHHPSGSAADHAGADQS